MANVIGSGAYFGGFSNEVRPTVSGEIGAKGTSYGNINSELYKSNSSYGDKGMSFGESVMKELQQKKKTSSYVEPEKTNQTYPVPPAANKLNLSNMLEKKAEKN